MLDANECRENAKRCVTLAAQTTDPVIKERLFETAQGWTRLAIDFAKFNDREAESQAPQSAAHSMDAIIR
jgi:hypothetical protein